MPSNPLVLVTTDATPCKILLSLLVLNLFLKISDKPLKTPISAFLDLPKKVLISKDDTVIMGGGGEKADVDERVDTIAQQMDGTSSDYDKEKLQERMGRLTGGVAVIKVGGASEVEVGELKDRIEDALCATRAAADEGIVPGGGSALLYASRRLDKMTPANFDQGVGIDIVKKACKIPV